MDELWRQERSGMGSHTETQRHVPVPSKRYVATVLSELAYLS